MGAESTQSGDYIEIFLYDGLETIQLSDNDYLDRRPKINDRGWVAWTGGLDKNEVFLYNGQQTVQLTDSTSPSGLAGISNNGLVLVGRSNKLFMYDGDKETQISFNDYMQGSDMNDRGWVTWSAGTWGAQPEIYLYDGNEVKRLTYNDHVEWVPKINNNGWVTWSAYSGGSDQIFLYNGTETVMLSNGWRRSGPKINDTGWVTWSGEDHGQDEKIYLYDGTDTVEIGSGFGAMINDRGWVTWLASDGNDLEIFLYDGSDTVQLTDNDYDDVSQQFNNLSWYGYDFKPGASAARSNYSGSSVKQYGDGWEDVEEPLGRLAARFKSSEGPNNFRTSISWFANDPSPMTWQTRGGDSSGLHRTGHSGIKSYTVQYDRPDSRGTWRTWKRDTRSTKDDFVGRDGLVYRFRVIAQDNAGNYGTSKILRLENKPPKVTLITPHVSTKTSKTQTFKVKWSAVDASGIDAYFVKVKADNWKSWRNWKFATKATSAYFKGKRGRTYKFRVWAKDSLKNEGVSKIKKTIVPVNEGANRIHRDGFYGGIRNSRSPYYLQTVKFSKRRGDTMTYRFRGKSLGLISTRGNRSKAKIYIDGRFAKTVDAYSSTFKPRRLIFERSWAKSGLHTIKVINSATPGRPRFDVDGLAVGR